MSLPSDTPRPRALLCEVQVQGVDDARLAQNLAELSRLVDTLGFEVVGQLTQKRTQLAALGVFGKGKLQELASWTGGPGVIARGPRGGARKREDEDLLEDEDDEPMPEEWPPVEPQGPRADVVVVDHELTSQQLRNLEVACGCEVLDRTGVIVEIFHRHASSREAKAQVEIARLNYLAPRLRETGPSERIGARAGGESKVELDARKIRDRLAELRYELVLIEEESKTRRQRRQDVLRCALVGYTNAGKSSFMRKLTGSDVYVADKLFATLGTTVRTLWPETRPKILVSDTVGFIQALPHDLVASFRSTLDEALEATLLIFVVDAADAAFREQLAVTKEVLGEIGAGEIPSMLLLNKIDKVPAEDREALAREFPDALQVSAKDPADVARVHDAIVARFAEGMVEDEVVVPYDKQSIVGEVHKLEVLSEDYDEQGAKFKVRGPKGAIDRIRTLLSR